MNIERKCDHCGDLYVAKSADLKRGWGKCCSKSCAAAKRTKREFSGNFRVAAASAKYSYRNDPRRWEASEAYHAEDPSWDAHKNS